jgi:hypothetical protein
VEEGHRQAGQGVSGGRYFAHSDSDVNSDNEGPLATRRISRRMSRGGGAASLALRRARKRHLQPHVLSDRALQTIMGPE